MNMAAEGIRIQINQHTIQRQNREQDRNRVRNNIERLHDADRDMRKAIREIVQQMFEVGSMSRSRRMANWRGQTERNHSEHVSDTLLKRYDTYASEADFILAEITQRIAALQDQSRDLTNTINMHVNAIHVLQAQLRAL